MNAGDQFGPGRPLHSPEGYSFRTAVDLVAVRGGPAVGA